MKKVVGVLFLAWLVSTGYIAGFATASIFYMTNVLAHVFLGAALLVAGARWLPKPALAALGVSTVLGAYLTWKGAVLENQAILGAHIVIGLVGLVLLLRMPDRKSVV